MKYTNRKDRLNKLQNKLNDAVICGNLHSSEVLNISTKVDKLILEFFLENLKKKQKENYAK